MSSDELRSVYSSAMSSVQPENDEDDQYYDFERNNAGSTSCTCFGATSRRFLSTEKELEKLATTTGLGIKEVHAFYDRFRKVAPKGFMTKSQFKQSLGLLGALPNDYIPNRMFAAFDSKKDGVITFDEYCTSFAVLVRGSEVEKLKLSFRLADCSGTGRLNFFDFSNLLIACDSTTNALIDKNYSAISDDETILLFREISQGRDFITMEQYVNAVRSNQRFLEILGLFKLSSPVGGKSVGVSPRSPTTPRSEDPNKVLRSDLERLRRDLVKSDKGLNKTDLLARLDAMMAGKDKTQETPRSMTPNFLTSPEVASEGSRPATPPVMFRLPIGQGSKRPQPPRLLGPKKGLAVHFGHESWNMVLNMMVGIRLAVGRASYEINRPVQSIDFDVKDKFSIVPQLTNFLDAQVSEKVTVTRFIDYAPFVFRKLRTEISGISDEEYLRSVGPEQLLGNMVLGNLSSLAEQTTEGKGGAFFYYTSDGRFMIKTVAREEKHLLKIILRDYYFHLKENPRSMIVRFYGLHGLRVKMNPVLFQGGKYRHDEKIYFVVMGNLFNTPLEVHRRYDLKGSWVNRKSTKEVEEDNTVALKDSDFLERGERLRVGPDMKKELMSVIQKDVHFFSEHNILDYSLLVGIHERGSGPSMAQDTPVSEASTPQERRPINSIQSPDGSVVYYMGIIDILCQWDSKKRLERFFKSIRYDSDGISAIPPEPYADRFHKFIDSIME
jgi:1-phosphatidylinositol-4-phosphate 5-kinase